MHLSPSIVENPFHLPAATYLLFPCVGPHDVRNKDGGWSGNGGMEIMC